MEIIVALFGRGIYSLKPSSKCMKSLFERLVLHPRYPEFASYFVLYNLAVVRRPATQKREILLYMVRGNRYVVS